MALETIPVEADDNGTKLDKIEHALSHMRESEFTDISMVKYVEADNEQALDEYVAIYYDE